MIYGIGADICDIRRIRASLARHGKRFAHRILSDGEMAIVTKDSVWVTNRQGVPITKKVFEVNWDAEAAEKGGSRRV